jgi:hypothetical protein
VQLRTPIMLWMMAAAVLSSCAPPSHHKPETGVIGKPPAPAEDPFFVVKLPKQAERAQASGVIGDLPSADAAPNKPEVTVKPPAADDPPAELKTAVKPKKISPPVPASKLLPEVTKPLPDKIDKPGSSPPGPELALTDKVQVPKQPKVERAPTVLPQPKLPEIRQERARPTCFSCVKICPLDDMNCPNQDVLCGWARAEDVNAARALARAECEGSLEMTQQMPPWKGITGHCPAPTCSE